jgi:hypothetical protein
MDLDELLHRYKMSLMCAQNASCAEARIVHEGLAEFYAGRIRDVRRKPQENAPLALGVSSGPAAI